MIITAKDTTGLVTNNLGNESRKLGIKASGWAHLSTILRDSLYSDKILAPIREYSTNAMDAHVEAGKPTRPILVKLPNLIVSTFVVRDYGVGMSEQRIWEVFANYGESTKRSSNEQTGMLGIGSKSAFAYTDNFTIVNYHRGVKSIFMCHVAGSAEGDLVRVSCEPTVEEDGLEIQIPVSKGDVSLWVDKAKTFFSYWKVTPIFEGNTVVIEKDKSLFEGETWYMSEKLLSQSKTKLLMGNICYEVDSEQLINKEDCTTFANYNNSIYSSGIVLKAEIGDVDVAASREGLQYTAKTKAYFAKVMPQILQQLTNLIQKEIDECKTNFEKKKLVNRFSDYHSKYYHLRFVTDNLIKKLGGSTYDLNLSSTGPFASYDSESIGLAVTRYKKTRRGHRRVRACGQFSTIECQDSIKYISVNDTDKQILNRVAALIERAPTTTPVKWVYVFKVLDKVKFNAWVRKVGFDIPLIKFDTLPIVKTSELYPTSSQSYSYNPKSSKKMFLLDRKRASLARHSYSDYYVPTLVDKNDKRVIYVEINQWQINFNGRDYSPASFLDFLTYLETTFNIKLPKIIAVRSSAVSKLKSQFVKLNVYLKELFSVSPNREKIVSMLKAACVNYIEIGSNYGYNSGDIAGYMNSHKFRLLFKNIQTSEIMDSESIFSKLREIIFNSSDSRELKTYREVLLNFVSNIKNCEKEIDDYKSMVTSLLKQFNKRYPVLCMIDDRFIGKNKDESYSKNLVEYVNFVDGNEKLVVS